MYKEDFNLPEWVKDPLCTPDESAFNKWYKEHFGCDVSPRSARYYQMRRSWMGAKEYYLSSNVRIRRN